MDSITVGLDFGDLVWSLIYDKKPDMNDHLFGKELFIQFTASAFRKLPSFYVFSYFPFGFEGRMWDLIVSVPGHCLSFYHVNNGHFKSKHAILKITPV